MATTTSATSASTTSSTSSTSSKTAYAHTIKEKEEFQYIYNILNHTADVPTGKTTTLTSLQRKVKSKYNHYSLVDHNYVIDSEKYALF